MICLKGMEFQTYAVHIINDMKDSNGSANCAWIVPARFKPLRFIGNTQGLEGDLTQPIVPGQE